MVGGLVLYCTAVTTFALVLVKLRLENRIHPPVCSFKAAESSHSYVCIYTHVNFAPVRFMLLLGGFSVNSDSTFS
jgi:hypothetical protein